jgi:hypothetical protein
MAAMAMNTNATTSIKTESKAAIERFLELNPPVAAILNEWFIASKRGIPAAQKARHEVIVSPRYTDIITQTTLVDLYL